MVDNHPMIWSIVGAIFAIFMIVVIHEWGHFLVARWCGVRVLRFSVGFGRALWSFRSSRTGTVFQIGWIPLGGYVKFAGEHASDEAVRPDDFLSQAPWKRLLIAAAGPLANLLLAVLLYSVINMAGIQFVKPVIGRITPDSIAEKAGLIPGHEIVAINQRPIQGWTSIATTLLAHVGDKVPVEMTTLSGKVRRDHQLNLSAWSIEQRNPDLIKSLGITPKAYPIPPVIASVQADSPAKRADMRPGDRIVQVDKTPIDDWMVLLKDVQAHPNQTMQFMVMRDGRRVALKIHIAEEAGKGHIGAVVKLPVLPKNMEKIVRYAPPQAVLEGLSNTGQLFALNAIIITKMLKGHISADTLGGPISILQIAGKASHAGWVVYVRFIAFVSVALAFLNLLPIPMLDGGHIVLYVIEWCRGKPISERYQLWGFKVGLFLLLWLMMWATFNDVMRLM